MKKLASLLLAGLFLITSADAGTISRPTKSFGGTSFVNGVIPLASDFNGDIDTVINEFNGSISNANISASAAIAGSKISPSFTTNPDVTSAAPCYKFIESDAAADGKRWDLCVNGGLWELRVVTDAGATTGTPMSIVRSTGAMLYTGSWSFANKVVLYNNAAITDGQLLIGKTSDSTFNAATLTGTASQVTVTGSAGGITLSLPSTINVTSALATALAADPTDCAANTYANAIAASGNLTCSTVTLASANFANQGTTTTLLHGNGAGNPSFGSVVDADHSGAVGVAHGGTSLTAIGDDAVVVGDGATSATARTLPNCTDVTGNHLNYTTATNLFSCGTTSSSAAGTLTAGTANTINPWAGNTASTTAHGLGVAPTMVICYFQNLTAELGYSIGDRIQIGSTTASSGVNGFDISYDATNTIIATTSAATPIIINKAGGVSATNLTAADWKIVCTPYKLN